jgi:hypothetical protein
MKSFIGSFFFSGCLLITLFTSCKSMLTSNESSPEGEIHNLQDLNANKTSLCEVFGTYEWVDPRQVNSQKLDPENPPENCQAGIRLEDGTMIYLQPTWKSSAARSKKELLEYHNKPVVVTGSVLAEGPPSPDELAYIKGPSMVGPIVIVDRESWDVRNGGELK